jgi:hypothetical protein
MSKASAAANAVVASPPTPTIRARASRRRREAAAPGGKVRYPDEVTASMRPAHVYARTSAEQHTALIHALHHEWRTATRLVMVVLSAAGWSASEIADLLAYNPKTVRVEGSRAGGIARRCRCG